MDKDVFIKIATKLAVFFFTFLLIHNIYFYTIVKPKPWEGDSIDYHIPIAEHLLSGEFVYRDVVLNQEFYPASNEIILAIYKFTNLPINTYNILAWILLTAACFFLAKSYKLDKYYSLLFALTIATLNVFVRWLGAQTIDIWMALFFTSTIIILRNKAKPDLKSALLLGIFFGMFLGSKYTALPFSAILIIFFWRDFYKLLSKFSHLIYFIVPFSILGISWYIRNYLLFDNPFYPLSFLFFQGTDLFSNKVFNISITHPTEMLNAFIMDLKIWILIFAAGPIIYFSKQTKKYSDIKKIVLLGFALFAFYPFFPTSEQSWIMVSSLRYAYPIFIILILSIFLVAEKIEKKKTLALITLGNMVLLHPVTYYPKLVFLYIPLGFLAVYFFDKKVK